MRNAVISFLIAAAVTLVLPRDLREAAVLAVRAGIGLIQFGFALDPDGYDAGWAQPSHEWDPGTQDAGLRAGVLHDRASLAGL